MNFGGSGVTFSHKIIMPPSKKQKFLHEHAGSRSKFAVIIYTCPDKTCGACFKTERGLAAHFGRSPTCANAGLKLLELNPVLNTSQQNIQSNNASETILEPTEMSVAEYESDEGIELVDDNEDDHEDQGEYDDITSTNDQNESSSVSSPPESQCFVDSLYFQTKLLKILHDANAPHYLYQKIIEWAQEMDRSEVAFEMLIKTRKGLIHKLEEFMPHMKYNSPYQVKTLLPTSNQPQLVDQTVFNFKKQLLSLIHDDFLFGHLFNLDINLDDPFGKYKSKNRILSVTNSGHRYQLAYQTMIKDPKKEFLMPIIFACDETKVSSQGKASCWPLLFTTTVINQSKRNLPMAWRPLGYIYDTSLLLSTNEEKKLGVNVKYKRLHRILDSILASYIKCQNDDSLNNIDLQLGNSRKIVDLKVPCFFIIGDMQGGDKMCCSAPVYSNRINRLCRKCNVKGSESGDPFVECKKIVSKRISDLVTNGNLDELKSLNQYCVRNAWFRVDFGGCPYGIFSAACPVEPLHALENGIIADCLKVLFSRVGSSSVLAELDGIARGLTQLPRQCYSSSGSDKSMPRLLWKDGITTLTDLTASAKVGIMFTIVIVSLTNEGKDFFCRTLGNTRILNDMRECFQMLLCYWVWLKKDTYWDRKDYAQMHQATDAIRQMLSKIITLWPRDAGQGWNLAKFHEQLHVPDDIYCNGCPQGSHSGPVEHNHIQMVKRPSQRTQKRRTNLDEQLATRLYESMLVNAAAERMVSQKHLSKNVPEPGVEAFGISRNASKTTLKVKIEPEARCCFYKRGTLRICPTAIEYLSEAYTNEIFHPEDSSTALIDVFSEFVKDGSIFRAHKNFRNTGPWHDWVMIRWDRTNNIQWSEEMAQECKVHHKEPQENVKNFFYSPAKILCFTNPHPDVYHAIVECCEFQFSRDSIFSTKWKKSYINKGRNQKVPYICHVDAEAIVRQCLVIPDSYEDVTYCHEIWDRSLWGDEFF